MLAQPDCIHDDRVLHDVAYGTHPKVDALEIVWHVMEDLAFVDEQALPVTDRMRLADAHLIKARNEGNNRRYSEFQEAHMAAFNEHLAVDRLAAMSERHAHSTS